MSGEKFDSMREMAHRVSIFEFALLGMAILPFNFGLGNLLDSTEIVTAFGGAPCGRTNY